MLFIVTNTFLLVSGSVWTSMSVSPAIFCSSWKPQHMISFVKAFNFFKIPMTFENHTLISYPRSEKIYIHVFKKVKENRIDLIFDSYSNKIRYPSVLVASFLNSSMLSILELIDMNASYHIRAQLREFLRGTSKITQPQTIIVHK